MFRKLLLALTAAATLALAGAAPSRAAMLAGGLNPANVVPATVEKTAFVVVGGVADRFWYNGRWWCWFDDGWHGPGYYWCGYGLRYGIGWGGPYGWLGYYWGPRYWGASYWSGFYWRGHYWRGHYWRGHEWREHEWRSGHQHWRDHEWRRGRDHWRGGAHWAWRGDHFAGRPHFMRYPGFARHANFRERGGFAGRPHFMGHGGGFPGRAHFGRPMGGGFGGFHGGWGGGRHRP